MSSEPIIRPAKPRDSEAIASLMHHSLYRYSTGLTLAVRRRGVMLEQTERLTAPLETIADCLRKRCVERRPLTEQMNP